MKFRIFSNSIFANKIVKLKLTILFLLLISNAFAQHHVQNGIIDLRDEDLHNDVIVLDGYWEFYWGKLIPANEFKPMQRKTGAQYVYVPSLNPKTADGEKFPRFGKATYRVTILVDSSIKKVGIRTPLALTSQAIYANGKLITQMGDPYADPSHYKGRVGFKVVSLSAKPTGKGYNIIDVVIHVADYKTVSFGLKSPMIISCSRNIYFWILHNMILYIVILSVMVYIAFINIVLAFTGKERLMNLSFAALIIAIVLRSFFENHVYIPEINYNIYSKFIFGIPALYPGLLMTFIYFAYPDVTVFRKKTIIIIDSISVGLFILTMFFPPKVFTHLILIIPVYILVLISLTTIKLVRRFLEGNIQFLLPAIGMIVLFATNVNDSLYAMRIIHSQFITYIGMFVYVVLQQLAKSIDYDRLMQKNLTLATQLEYQNRYLTELVRERTKQIEEQKDELIVINKELSKQNEEILAQKEEIEYQKSKIDSQNRHLKASIEYASSIQKAILPTYEEISRYFDNFVFYKPKEIVSGDFYMFLTYESQKRKCFFAAVVDCTGHGIPGAFMSLISYMILTKIIISHKTLLPRDILREANREVRNILHQKSNRNIDGFDISLVKIIPDEDKFIVLYSGARLPLFYKDTGDTEVSRIRGLPKSIGGYVSEKDEAYKTEQVRLYLSKGAMIWLASDGYIDQINTERKKFGTQRLMQLLNEIADLDPAEQKKILEDTFYKWKGIEQQRDDVTVFGIRL